MPPKRKNAPTDSTGPSAKKQKVKPKTTVPAQQGLSVASKNTITPRNVASSSAKPLKTKVAIQPPGFIPNTTSISGQVASTSKTKTAATQHKNSHGKAGPSRAGAVLARRDVTPPEQPVALDQLVLNIPPPPIAQELGSKKRLINKDDIAGNAEDLWYFMMEQFDWVEEDWNGYKASVEVIRDVAGQIREKTWKELTEQERKTFALEIRKELKEFEYFEDSVFQCDIMEHLKERRRRVTARRELYRIRWADRLEIPFDLGSVKTGDGKKLLKRRRSNKKTQKMAQRPVEEPREIEDVAEEDTVMGGSHEDLVETQELVGSEERSVGMVEEGEGWEDDMNADPLPTQEGGDEQEDESEQGDGHHAIESRRGRLSDSLHETLPSMITKPIPFQPAPINDSSPIEQRPAPKIVKKGKISNESTRTMSKSNQKPAGGQVVHDPITPAVATPAKGKGKQVTLTKSPVVKAKGKSKQQNEGQPKQGSKTAPIAPEKQPVGTSKGKKAIGTTSKEIAKPIKVKLTVKAKGVKPESIDASLIAGQTFEFTG